ncbi:MAG: M20/M25/M40 family metallo-hydrolase [Acidobacteriota bacterium]|nr:M20/M25/M40 family metallo-hydrolase [Acidobacteriota bacterium]
MDIFQLTRALVDIESITENELLIGEYLYRYLKNLAAEYRGEVETWHVAPNRFNVFAWWGTPAIVLSTHIDTVPPFFPSGEDDTKIWGRGSCDTKGIIAAMIFAIRELLNQGTRNIGLLLVVGEERNSAGALAAAELNRGAKIIINGEPTGNKLALGSKGALRFNLKATGRMAHSAYPELGESAIEKLLDALTQIRDIPLPHDDLLGASTLNIGTIHGGRAPNVIPDQAEAELFIRLVDDGHATKAALQKAVHNLADLQEVLTVPAVSLGALPGFETTVVAFTTDIPAFGKNWGVPYLLGPGSINVAHTLDEHIPKKELVEAVQIYKKMVHHLA